MTAVIKARHIHVDSRVLAHLNRAAPVGTGPSPAPAGAPLGLESHGVPPMPDDDLVRRAREECEALEARLEATKTALLQLEQDAKAREEAAYERGMAEGMASGEAAARKVHATHDAALRDGIAQAVRTFHEQMQSLETLAIDLALASLERIFGEPGGDGQRVSRTISHHVRHLAGEAVIGIEVSPLDFPTEDALASAFAMTGHARGTRIARNDALARGECAIRLHSCMIDASPESQLERIRTGLEAMRP